MLWAGVPVGYLPKEGRHTTGLGGGWKPWMRAVGHGETHLGFRGMHIVGDAQHGDRGWIHTMELGGIYSGCTSRGMHAVGSVLHGAGVCTPEFWGMHTTGMNAVGVRAHTL